MIREEILSMIEVGRPGLEIGPLNKPIVARDLGPVEYIDRASREELQRDYSDIDGAGIVEVDHVWGDQSLAECVGSRRYAYLVASHVIEHVPDLFGWLGEIASVLEDGGLAAFAVPDKRYTFDVLRRTSGDGELVDAYVRRLRRPDPRQIFDCFHNKRDLQLEAIGNGASPADVPPENSALYLANLCRQAEERREYVDAHCWVFTPRSLLSALDLGSQIDALPFEIACLKPTIAGTAEFLLVLRRLPDAMSRDAQRAAFVASRDCVVLPDEAGALDHEAEVTLARAHRALARVAAMEASTSWRITAPLRAAATMVRRWRGTA